MERRLRSFAVASLFPYKVEADRRVVLFDLYRCRKSIPNLRSARKSVRNAHRVIEFSLRALRNGSAISLSSLLPSFLQKHSASLTSYVAPNWLAKYFIRCLDRPLYLIDRWIIGRLNCKVAHQRLALLWIKKNVEKTSLKEYILL